MYLKNNTNSANSFNVGTLTVSSGSNDGIITKFLSHLHYMLLIVYYLSRLSNIRMNVIYRMEVHSVSKWWQISSWLKVIRVQAELMNPKFHSPVLHVTRNRYKIFFNFVHKHVNNMLLIDVKKFIQRSHFSYNSPVWKVKNFDIT